MVAVLLDGGFIASIFTNIANFVKAFGSYSILIIGLALIIVSVIHVVRGFARKVGWGIIICSFLFGGAMVFGGWKILTGSAYGRVGLDTLSAINDGNTPSAVDVIEAGTGNTGLDNAQTALAVMSDNFFVPFGQTVSVSVGIALIVLAVGQIAGFFIKSGKGQLSLPKVIAMFVIGAVLFTATPTNNSAGWAWIRDKLVGAARDGVVNIVEGNSTAEADASMLDS